MGKILFSPLGKTDPISNQRDGSMLHICRIYKPDKVYLYMSKEILQDHESDNRYVFCLEKLGELLDHNFEIEIIKRPELVYVHKLDDFYEEFKRCLQEIEKENEGEILFNVSSGTPAMKMGLQVLASLYPERYTAIQVETPAKAANKEHEDTDHYDVKLQWECNLDNQETFIDRSSRSKTDTLFLNIQKENIKRLIREYDYSAALMLAENMEGALSGKAVLYLKAAERRNLLDISGAQKLLGKETQDVLQIAVGEEKDIIEYLINLNIKLRKRQYADYIRAITPVVLDILLVYMRKKQGVSEEKFCVRSRKGIWYLNINKMEKSAPDILAILKRKYPMLKENPLSSDYVSEIILAKEEDLKVISSIEKIREVEREIRNYAAHEIVAITEESILRDASIRPEEIIELLKFLSIRAGIKIRKEDWKSYDRMNENIIHAIEEVV
nr:hypothetical protein [Massilistercora timonensis]